MYPQFLRELELKLSLNEGKESTFFKESPYNKEFRSNFKTKTAPRQGAVLVLLYPEGNTFNIPLMRRTSVGSHKNQISFPGGKVDELDLSFKHTALREFEEEFGHSSSEIKVLGKLSPIFIPPSNFLVNPIVGYINYKPDFNPNKNEVEYITEISIQEILNPMNLKKEIIKESGFHSPLPYFEIKNEIIWGATAAILDELVEIIKD